MRRSLLLPALAAAALAAACPSFDENGRYACSSDEDCSSAAGERCVEGACAVPLEPCGNGRCDPDECEACPGDCVSTDCASGACNLDGSCDPGESCFSCTDDCAPGLPCGRCGDEGNCEPAECALGCAECELHPVCLPDPCAAGGEHPANETSCTDLVDDDCDGGADCDDPDGDCVEDPACSSGDEICDNGVDDDGDGLTDCADPDCASTCPSETDCAGGTDDDADGWQDCEDLDCWIAAACVGQPAEDCTNGHDDDGQAGGDPGVDCQDPSCAQTPACELTCNGAPVQTALQGSADGGLFLRLPATGPGINLGVDCGGTLASSAFLLAWQAPADGTFRFHTVGSSARSILVVTDGQACSDQIACGVSPEDGTLSEATAELTSGQTVVILLAPLDPSAFSQLWLWIEQTG